MTYILRTSQLSSVHCTVLYTSRTALCSQSTLHTHADLPSQQLVPGSVSRVSRVLRALPLSCSSKELHARSSLQGIISCSFPLTNLGPATSSHLPLYSIQSQMEVKKSNVSLLSTHRTQNYWVILGPYWSILV